MKRAFGSLIASASVVSRLLWRRTRAHRPPDPGRRRRWLWSAAGVLAAAGVVGMLFVLAGLVPIAASAGHWAPTTWFLQLAKRRSVATHTLGLAPPDLGAPWLVLKGAGHYETGCRPCHGSPDLPHPRVAWAMTPPPPYLPPRVASWDPDELFYIVKHGIKFTGMPAWPSQHRDDEVTAMVAFLVAFPTLDGDAYHALVFGDTGRRGSGAAATALVDAAPIGSAATARCARCHGPDGNGRGSAAFPKLAGQRDAYLAESMLAYARGDRASGIMQPIAAGFSADEVHALARHFGSQAVIPAAVRAVRDDDAIARGRQIAESGIPSRRVPACADCHGPTAAKRNPRYPVLAGQFADYLALQLKLFVSGRRGGTSYAGIMRRAAADLRPDDIHAVAHYYASLAPEPRAP